MQMYIKKGKAPYWMSKIRQSLTVLNCKEKYKADKLSPGPSLFSPTHQVPRVLQKGSLWEKKKRLAQPQADHPLLVGAVVD